MWRQGPQHKKSYMSMVPRLRMSATVRDNIRKRRHRLFFFEFSMLRPPYATPAARQNLSRIFLLKGTGFQKTDHWEP